MKDLRQVDSYYPNTRGGETIPEDVLDYVDMYTQQNKFQYVDNIKIFGDGMYQKQDKRVSQTLKLIGIQ